MNESDIQYHYVKENEFYKFVKSYPHPIQEKIKSRRKYLIAPNVGIIGYKTNICGQIRHYVNSKLFYNKYGKRISGYYRPYYYYRTTFCFIDIPKDNFDKFLEQYPRTLIKDCEDGKFIIFLDPMIGTYPNGIVAAYSIIPGDYCYIVKDFLHTFRGKFCKGCGKELRRNIYRNNSLEPYDSFLYRNYCGSWCYYHGEHTKSIRITESQYNDVCIIEYYDKDFTYEEAEKEAQKFYNDTKLNNLLFIAVKDNITIKIGDIKKIDECYEYLLNFGGSSWYD